MKSGASSTARPDLANLNRTLQHCQRSTSWVRPQRLVLKPQHPLPNLHLVSIRSEHYSNGRGGSRSIGALNRNARKKFLSLSLSIYLCGRWSIAAASRLHNDFYATIFLGTEGLIELRTLVERCAMGNNKRRINLAFLDAFE
jgi:hypothetical protein